MKDLFDVEEIRALNWKYPYSAAMLHDKIETRTWSTNYRGKVLICESKIPYKVYQTLEIAGLEQYKRLVSAIKDNPKLHGKAIAIGELVDCRPMTKEDEAACFVQYREPWTEERFNKKGEWYLVAKQLWCHIYTNVQPIIPFEFSALQGWKRLNEIEMRQIIRKHLTPNPTN